MKIETFFGNGYGIKIAFNFPKIGLNLLEHIDRSILAVSGPRKSQESSDHQVFKFLAIVAHNILPLDVDKDIDCR